MARQRTRHHPDQVMTCAAPAPSIAYMTTDAPTAATATPARPPGESRSRGWLIALGVALVIVLGVLTAAVISRGDSGATTTVQPPGVTVQQTVSVPTPTVSVKTVTAPATTVQVQPTVTVQETTATTP
jgi:flagellar basal body-associated protein FliL